MLFEAFIRRQIVEELKERKLSQINALMANTNYDNPEADRNRIIQGLEDNFEEAVAMIYNPEEMERREQLMKTSPFFTAMRVPQIDVPKESETVTLRDLANLDD